MAAVNPQGQPALGLRLLYLPHHLFIPGARPTPPSQYAHANIPNSTLPFMALGGDDDQTFPMPTNTILPDIIRNIQHSTQSKSHTQPAHIISTLRQDDRLVYFKRCPQLNERLRQYADPQSGGVVPESDEQTLIWREHWPPQDHIDQATRDQVKDRGITTLGSFEWPDADSQWQALVEMGAWAIKHRFAHAWLSESEPATQSLVERHLLDLLVHILQVRSSTSILTAVHDVLSPYYVIKSRYRNEVALQDLNLSDEDLLKAQNSPHTIPFPYFGRATKKNNIIQSKSSAGYPDYLLFDPIQNSANLMIRDKLQPEKHSKDSTTPPETPKGDNRSGAHAMVSRKTKKKQVKISEEDSGINPTKTPPVKVRWSLCCEIKTDWSYKKRIFEDAISALSVGADGRFRWTARGEGVNFMKQVCNTHVLGHGELEKRIKDAHHEWQIWGELYSYQRDWGFTANSSTIMIYIRTARNELVVGDLITQQGPDTTQIMAGLMMASIDALVRPWLRKYLCDGSTYVGAVDDDQ